MDTTTAAAPSPPRRLRLLVVEDSEADFALLEATLRRQGLDADCLRVEEADAMAQALASRPWDAVISDHNLPRFSSGEALATLKASGLILPFLIVSGEIGEDTAVAAMRAGADDYLIKGKLGRLGPALTHAIDAAEARRARLRSEAALRVSEQRLQALSAHLLGVVEEERSAIAREIHDEIGGALTALRYDLSWIARNSIDTVAQRAGQALETLGAAQVAGQRLVRNLRPPILDAGILPALEWQLTEFRRRTGATAHLRTNTDRLALSEAASMTVYRTLQEALTNVVKHANATRVDVDLIAADGMLSLEIRDDGRGITSEDIAKATSYGLRGLAERAKGVGGWLDVAPGGRGTTLMLTVPLAGAATDDFTDEEA